MNADFHRSFEKQFKKLPSAWKERVIETVEQFCINPMNSKLGNHSLSGEWLGYHSIRVGGDYRIHYRLETKNNAVLVAVGTHAQLYK